MIVCRIPTPFAPVQLFVADAKTLRLHVAIMLSGNIAEIESGFVSGGMFLNPDLLFNRVLRSVEIVVETAALGPNRS